MRQVDPYLALVRNAVFAEQGPARVSPLDRRTPPRSIELEPIADEVREQYAYELAEREGLLMDSGLEEFCGSRTYHGGECCARHVALGELGCVEFYDHATALPFVRGLVRVPAPRPVGLCTRCESVGHEVQSCPFGVGDADVTKIARLRREMKKARAA